nr:NADH dehydrogenase (ubiquinone) 1 beta subcomplex 9 [Cryptococcus depauperatus CBS 7855]
MSSPPTAFSNAHRLYVKSLYKRYLTNALNWYIRRDLWRQKAIEIRAEFERNSWLINESAPYGRSKYYTIGSWDLLIIYRNITDPRALAIVLEQAEEKLAKRLHPDPYRPPLFPDGTKWLVWLLSFYRTSTDALIFICNRERNIPPRMFTAEEKAESLAHYYPPRY